MVLDLVVLVLLLLAVFRGYQRGLIVGIFSFIALVVGLAAAIKLSAVVAGRMGKAVKVSDQWLPILSFVAVFIIVVLLVRWAAMLLQRSVELAMLGWVNRLGGILLYSLVTLIILSVFVFYAQKVNVLGEETIRHSLTYSFIEPWGPRTINGLGSVFPVFKDMFRQLEDFFAGISGKISLI